MNTIDQILRTEEVKADAKDYISKGLSVIPVGANKIPLIPWKEFHDRIAKPEEIDAWFEKFPNAQLGVVTGKISHITVVDVEFEGGEEQWNKLPQNGTIVKTGGGGRHYWFKYEPNFKNAVRIDGQMQHTDIRNDGGYVIAPPSISEKGSYEWIRKANLVDFPKHLFKPKGDPVIGRGGYVAEQTQSVGMKYLANLYEGNGQGSRNDSMVKYIGYILTQIHPSDWEAKAWPMAIEANSKNTPPLGGSELRNSYDSICRTEKAKAPTRWQVEEPRVRETVDKLPVKTDYKLRYTWGTRGLDTSLAIIKRGNFIVLGARSGSGKTTLAFDMAQKNAMLGHKVLFISLEMDEKEVKDAVARKSSGITIAEELDYTIPEYKQKNFEEKLFEIDSIENLFFKGVRRGGGVTWDELEDIFYSFSDLDLIIIDNLDLIDGAKGENDMERQKRIVKKIMGFTSEKQIPIILIHHYRKTMSKDKASTNLEDLSGSMKIVDGADRIINISRNLDPNAPYPEKYISRIYLQKGREYPEALKDIYFMRGVFTDTPLSRDDYYSINGVAMTEYEKENIEIVSEDIKKEAMEKELESIHKEQMAQAAMFGDK